MQLVTLTVVKHSILYRAIELVFSSHSVFGCERAGPFHFDAHYTCGCADRLMAMLV